MKPSILLLALLALSAAGCTKKESPTSNVSPSEVGHEDPDGYYTCPMHPQVHAHEPGNCPICGMALVKVSGAKREQKTAFPSLQPGDYQLANAGIGKITVTRRDLTLSLPVSGRLTGPRSVVFQVYEKDLALIKTGIPFVGSASTNSAEEITGRVMSVDNLVDPSSRTLRVIGSLNRSPSPFALEGMFLGRIQIFLKDQIAVPEDAVLHTGRKEIVYKIGEGNKITPVEVRLGFKAEGQYQILSGIQEGDIISGGPNFLIDSEAKIRSLP